MAIASNTAPTRSGNGALSFGAFAGSADLPLTYARRQNGGRTRNAHRQPNESTISEPIAGPVATPKAVKEPHFATVAIRIESGVPANNNPNEAGVNSAPPTPCATLAVTTIRKLGAAPTNNDDAANTAKPSIKTRRRPKRSASRPAGIKSAAKEIV